MAKKTVRLGSNELSKAITMHLAGLLLRLTGKRLTPRQMEEIRQAIEPALQDGNYLKEALEYDKFVYRYLN